MNIIINTNKESIANARTCAIFYSFISLPTFIAFELYTWSMLVTTINIMFLVL